MEWIFNFYASPAELAEILCELAPRHGLRFFGGPSNTFDAPHTEEILVEPGALAARLGGSCNPVWIAGPWSIHPLAFRQLAIGPLAGKYTVVPQRSGPHFMLLPPGNNFLGGCDLRLRGTYTFDPEARDEPLGSDPGPDAIVDVYPPTPQIELAFESLVAGIRERLIRHDRPGSPVWTGPSFARAQLRHIGSIPLPEDGIRRAKWVARPEPRPTPRAPDVWSVEALHALTLEVPDSAIEAEFPEDRRIELDEDNIRDAVARLDGRSRACLILRVITKEAARCLLVYGGRQGRVLARWVDNTDGADVEVYLLDLSGPIDETMEQLDEHGMHVRVPRSWCVDKETAVCAALHFTQTGGPDPRLSWGT